MEIEPDATNNSMLPAILTNRQESLALHYSVWGDPVGAYCHAYNPTTTRRASLQTLAYRALRHPKVAARITALRNANAADATMTRDALIRDLEAMVDVDVNELVQLRIVPCAECWPDRAVAVAMGRAVGGWAPMPDLEGPRHDCPVCAGSGRPVGHLFNTADLPLPARRLFKGLEFYESGVVKKVLLHDQAALRVELHRLKGMHVDRSVSVNVNADLKPLKRGMSVEEAIALMETIAPTVPDDSSVVSDQ